MPRPHSTPAWFLLPIVLALFCAAAEEAEGSDPTAIYALIDNVELIPRTAGSGDGEGRVVAQRAIVKGAFCFRSLRGRRNYDSPVEGYLYLEVIAGKEEECRREWKDFAAVAGKGVVVAFGSRWEKRLPKLHRRDPVKAGARIEADAHPLQFGVRKLALTNSYKVNRWLRYLPRPESPSQVVEGHSVALVVRNCVATDDVRYLFEIESSEGAILGSGMLEPGKEGTTQWKPRITLVPGHHYVWRVRVVPNDEQLQSSSFGIARATFSAKSDEKQS